MAGIKSPYFNVQEKSLIGDALKKLREASRLTQSDVAEFLGSASGASSNISRIENGQTPLSASMALDLLISVATNSPDDTKLLSDLFNEIPALALEAQLRVEIEAARVEGRLTSWGTLRNIAIENGGTQSLCQRVRRMAGSGKET